MAVECSLSAHLGINSKLESSVTTVTEEELQKTPLVNAASNGKYIVLVHLPGNVWICGEECMLIRMLYMFCCLSAVLRSTGS